MRRIRLALRRKAVGLSQEHLAEYLGVDRSTVVRWEGGATEPQPWHRPHLAKALRMSINELACLLADNQQNSDAYDSAEQPALDARELVTARPADISRTSNAHRGGDMLRRDLLARSVGAAGLVTTAPLAKILLGNERTAGETSATLAMLPQAVAEAKRGYQAGGYAKTLELLTSLLPAINSAQREGSESSAAKVHALATDAYHTAGSVLLKLGDQPMALLAAERSARHAAASNDPIAAGTSARIMTHALMSAGQTARAVDFAQDAAQEMERNTRLADQGALSVYGALVLRAALAAAQTEDRDKAHTLMDEASRAAQRFGLDRNDRWTGFGPTNVLQHQVTVALMLGDAGTAVAYARHVPVEKIKIAERRASFFIDLAQAYSQWRRKEDALAALRTAYDAAAEEVRSRQSVHRIVEELAALSRGHLCAQVRAFAIAAGVAL